ncbi:MAG: hypothetical protein HYU56_00525 [Candidatus Aenigmarchaeota archaeon]|nr:hypothetical protein [Candidatus Aenigmarchaeota archaeon]
MFIPSPAADKLYLIIDIFEDPNAIVVFATCVPVIANVPNIFVVFDCVVVSVMFVEPVKFSPDALPIKLTSPLATKLKLNVKPPIVVELLVDTTNKSVLSLPAGMLSWKPVKTYWPEGDVVLTPTVPSDVSPELNVPLRSVSLNNLFLFW